MNPMIGRWIVSGVAAAALVAHLIWPNLRIDAITLGLLVIVGLPWLGHIFKSLEFPGGWKIEYQDIQKVSHQAAEAGLISTDEDITSAEYSFQTVADLDPNLALAGLRIEMERKLSQLAESRGVHVRQRGIGFLLRELNARQVINAQERSVLADLTALLNSAVHGAVADPRASAWAIEQGSRILAALERRVSNPDAGYEGVS